ncbi:uncharacterized protein [Ptychodera flava]|uniref:uncharacterized protein n=1 Tax=Ptychodera flava TaxID=63121 RepID=UPI00396A28BF
MNNFNFLKDKMKGMIRIIIKLEDRIDEHLQVAKGSAEFPMMRDIAWHIDVLHSRVKAATTALSGCYIEALPCNEDCQGNEKVIASRPRVDDKTGVKMVEEKRRGGMEPSGTDSYPCAVHTIGHMDDFNVLTEKMMGMHKSLTKTKIIVSEYRRVMKVFHVQKLF